jgi:hypothetical protein
MAAPMDMLEPGGALIVASQCSVRLGLKEFRGPKVGDHFDACQSATGWTYSARFNRGALAPLD